MLDTASGKNSISSRVTSLLEFQETPCNMHMSTSVLNTVTLKLNPKCTFKTSVEFGSVPQVSDVASHQSFSKQSLIRCHRSLN